MKLLRRALVAIAVFAVVAYGGVLAYISLNQRSLQYDVAGKFLDLGETTLTNAELVEIPTSDNERIRGWYAPPQAGKPVIVFYKGNARSFTADHERYEQFVADGFGFLAFDYRGFPASPGVLNQDNVLKDSIAAFAFAQNKGFPLVIWGRSLGSGPATYVASQRDAEALLLETPFDSALSVGQERYWYLPVGLLMSDQYPVDQWIAGVEEPVYVAVGTADTTIPAWHGERAYELAPNKAGLWVEPGAGHSDLWDRGLWGRAKAFFEAPATAQ
ncbi:MAG: alpha/beta hydrolase [Hyphomicrobiales bacterium]|nr:MAG: alpha/beta hydrolase [Hyphomicrobiales bacterium]